MNGDQLFQAALAEAKKLAEILPILQGIQENPKEAFEMMVKDRKEIYHLEMNIKKLKEALIESRRENEELRAAMIAYALEFAPDKDGNPDTGSIHENIRKMKAKLDKIDEALKL